MKFIFIPQWFLILISYLVIVHGVHAAMAATIELEQTIHFGISGDDPVVVSPGTYILAMGEHSIHLVHQAEGKEFRIEAAPGTHDEDISEMVISSIPVDEDVHLLQILLPNGKSLEATGNYSGVRSRQTQLPYVLAKPLYPEWNTVFFDHTTTYRVTNEGYTLEACSATCLLDQKCKAYQWTKDKGRCHLSSEKPLKYILNPQTLDNVIGGIRAGPIPSTHGVVPLYQTWFGPARKDLAKQRGLTLQSCSQKCLSNPNCKGFQWFVGKGRTRPYCQHIPGKPGIREPKPWTSFGGNRKDFVSGIIRNNKVIAADLAKYRPIPKPKPVTFTDATLTLLPTNAIGGTTVRGTVRLTGTATRNFQVALSSSDSDLAPVPASIVVRTGQRQATFSIVTEPVQSDTSVVIAASSDGVTKPQTLTLRPKPAFFSELRVAPTLVTGGSGTRVTGTVQLNMSAIRRTPIYLKAGNPSLIRVPSSVWVEAKRDRATFQVTASTPVATTTPVTILASRTPISETVEVIKEENNSVAVSVIPPTLKSLQCTAPQIPAGASVQCTLTLTGPVANGVQVSSVLESSHPALVTIPTQLTISSSQRRRTFIVKTSATNYQESLPASLDISATYQGMTKKATLTVTLPTNASGQPNNTTPTMPGGVIITEVMVDPSRVSDTAGEWFEVYNPTNSDLELKGLIVTDGGTQHFTIGRSLVIPARGFLVLGNNDDQKTNGGVPVDFVYAGFTLVNAGGAIQIMNSTATIDSVRYGASFRMTTGRTISLDPRAFNVTANDTGTNWCVAEQQLPGGDFGSPGSLNPPCP